MEFGLDHLNIDNIEKDIAFLNAANKYEFPNVPDGLKQVIIFVPYSEKSNEYKAAAKQLATYFYPIDTIIFDTKYTYKTAQNCLLFYKEISSTILLTIDFLISEGHTPVLREAFECLKKEQKYLMDLISQNRVNVIGAEAKNALSVT